MIKSRFGEKFFAIGEQGFFALSNFILNVFIVRYLSLSILGSFSYYYALIILFSNVYTATLIEPFLVYSGSFFKKSLKQYIYKLTGIALSLFLVGSGLIYLITKVLNTDFSISILIFALIYLFSLSIRKFFFTLKAIQFSFLGSLVYFGSVTVGLIRLHNRQGEATLDDIFFILILAAFLSVVVMCVLLFTILRKMEGESNDLNDIIRLHFGYSKWSVPTWVVRWLPVDSFYFTLPVINPIDGLVYGGILKSYMNFVMPLVQVMNSISSVLLVRFSSLASENKTDALTKLRKKERMIAAMIGGCFLLGMFVFGKELFNVVYQNGKVFSYSILALILSYSLLYSIVIIESALVRGMDKPNLNFNANLIASLISVTLGLIFVNIWGVISVGGSLILYAIILLFILIKTNNQLLQK